MKRLLCGVIALLVLFLFPQESSAQFNGLMNKVKSKVEKTVKEKGKQTVDNAVRKSNLKHSDSELCQVFNCPALLTQCKRIQGTWQGLK